MNTRTAHDLFTSGIVGSARLPRGGPVAGRPLVLYGHGGGNTSAEMHGAHGITASDTLTRRLGRGGMCVLAPTSTLQYGNATARARWADAHTARTVYGATGPVFAVGASAGFTAACAYARANPGVLTGIVGLIPLIDLVTVHAANTLGLAASLETAYGGPPTSADNPLDFAPEIADVTIVLYVASNDAVSVNADAFAAAHGNTTLLDVGPLGHTNNAIAAAPPDDIYDVIRAA